MQRVSLRRTPASTGWLTRTTETWRFEVIAATFSLSCFVALVILLARLDTKPTFYWHGVTVNALVSILSTASRASLFAAVGQSISQVKWIHFKQGARPIYQFQRIEVASQDAFSQIALLSRSPFGLASLGAFALLLTLAFDPFAQQLVQTRAVVDYHNSSSLARLPVTNLFNTGIRIVPSATQVNPTCPDSSTECNYTTLECKNIYQGSTGGITTIADFGLQAAVLNGLNSDTSSGDVLAGQLRASCPSGNCTWPAVDSLAICSQCVDISDQLTRIDTLYATRGTGDEGPPDSCATWWALDQSNSAATVGNSTTYVLPNGLCIQNEQGVNASGALEAFKTGKGSGSRPTVLMTSFGTGEASQTIAFRNDDMLLWAMSFIQADQSSTSLWRDIPIVATECALSFCVKSFSSNVTNGILYENETAADSYRDPNSWQPTSKYPALTEDQKASLAFDKCVSFAGRTDLILGRGFNISQNALNSLSAYLSSVFTGNLRASLTNVSDTYQLRQFNGWVLVMGNTNLQWSPATMKPLVGLRDYNTTFASVARSMTLSLRAGSPDQVSGNVGAVQIVIKVRWLWIILPATTVVAGLIQLGLSMFWTKKTGAPVWKSSLLAMFARGGEVTEALASSRTLAEMEKTAKATTVDLFPHREAVRLRRRDVFSSQTQLMDHYDGRQDRDPKDRTHASSHSMDEHSEIDLGSDRNAWNM